jgi:hypothetical protein
MGDDSIDMVISHIDMGYLVTLVPTSHSLGTGVQGHHSASYLC